MSVDIADLGRGLLTRWLPVLWQASSEPPLLPPFDRTDSTTPRRFLLRVVLSAKRLTIPAAFLFVICQICEALVPIVMGLAIDRSLATGERSQLILWLIILGLVFATMATTMRLSQQLNAFAKERVEHRLRSTLSATVLHPGGSTRRRPDGELLSIMTNDVGRLAAVGLGVFPAGEVAAIAFIAVSLLLIHWPLGVVVILGAPMVVWLMGAMSGQYARSSRAYQALLSGSVGRAADLLVGYRVIKGVRAEEEATERYRRASQAALDGAKRNTGSLGRYLAGSTSVSGVFVAAVACLAGWFTVQGRMTVGELIAAAGLTQALIPQMSMVTGNAVPAWAAAIASSARVLDTLRHATPTHSGDEEPGGPAGNLPEIPAVEIHVGSHPPIHLEPGELVGIAADDVTANAIANALLDPHVEHDDVQVRIGQVPALQLDRRTYRSRVAVSPHLPALFSGTVGENLALLAASPELLTAALRAAACEDFVTGGTGLDAQVGQNGQRLSGGQRQRLALARALATDSPVLVLHDPTTSLDVVTEALIAQRLPDLRRGRTTVLVASSPALLAACERVVEMCPVDRNDTPGRGPSKVSPA